MSVARLQKQLQRELKRNSQKAGALALLVLVAGWFWAPLIFSKDEAVVAVAAPVVPAASPVSSPSTSGTSVVSGALQVAAPAAGASDKLRRWQDLAQAIENDARMHTVAVVTEDLLARSPFVTPRKIEQEAKPAEVTEKKVVAIVAPSIAPEEAGLEVSATILSRERRTAMINGQAYRLGEELEPRTGVIFKIAGIGPAGVLLERNGEQFALAIRRSQRTGRSDLRPTN